MKKKRSLGKIVGMMLTVTALIAIILVLIGSYICQGRSRNVIKRRNKIV